MSKGERMLAFIDQSWCHTGLIGTLVCTPFSGVSFFPRTSYCLCRFASLDVLSFVFKVVEGKV